MKHLFTLIIVVLFIHFSSNGQSYNSIDSITKSKIDSTYNSLLKKTKAVGLSLAIVDNGEIVYSVGYGFADREKEIKADDNTVYRIGSITKSFTTLSVMQLHHLGKLDITKPISDYLTDFSMQNTKHEDCPIYIKNMMSHTAGMPCDIFNGFFAKSPPDQTWAIGELKKQYTIGPPDYVMAYSNVGYGLLGELIARTSGMGYEDYLTEHVFKPLNMNSAYVYYDSTKHIKAKGYLKNKPIDEPSIRDVSAGLIHGSALDLANYLLMYLNNGTFNGTEILPKELIAEMETNRLDKVLLNNHYEYGYGLFKRCFMLKNGNDSSVVSYIGHGGDTYAYHADFGFIPKLNVGAVLMTNTEKGARIVGADKLLKLYIETEKKDTLNVEYSPIDLKEVKYSPENEIIGTYQSLFGLFTVDNPLKIKFKQGPAKISLTRADVDSNFTGKAKIFGLIPVKIKNQEFNFVNLDGKVFFADFIGNSGRIEYLGVKSTATPIPESWKKAYGTYKATGTIFACPPEFGFDLSTIEAKLYEEKGFLVIEYKGKTKDLQGKIVLNVVDDQSAVGATYGRSSGDTVRILPNGNLYISGLELKKEGK